MKTVKNPIKVDFAKGIITLSKTFANKAAVVTTKEFAQLANIKTLYPEYTIVIREIMHNPNKESYKGLTYDYMRKYIILHTSPSEREAAISDFEEMILISQCHSQARRYPTIKRWFLDKYPRVAEFGLDLNSLLIEEGETVELNEGV